jgi:hypothetical protein
MARLDEVNKVEADPFAQLLSALNPFTRFVFDEVVTQKDSSKEWELDQSFFKNQQQAES